MQEKHPCNEIIKHTFKKKGSLQSNGADEKSSSRDFRIEKTNNYIEALWMIYSLNQSEERLSELTVPLK